MTRIMNNPREFTDDALSGFLNLYAEQVAGVFGGVVRRHVTPPGKVAVVVGGGSGHYPAFCGVVGYGFADGAVVGNIFTSPSAAEAESVAKAAASDAGVLIMSGNYAGDVMHFTQAAERLRSGGMDARVLFVTDDIASAPEDAAERRRGVAGDFVVFKLAGAAAEALYDLDGVERVARKANDRTRTLGVAFAGCTLPGSHEPLFRVPEHCMAVGLGIHGEPGVSDAPLTTASDLAERLVGATLAEVRPEDGSRLAVILNGLGSTKYEELFVLWGHVSDLLVARGFALVRPEVGELVTSLDMAGVSLTLTALDEELESLWCSEAVTPAYTNLRRTLPSELMERDDAELSRHQARNDYRGQVAKPAARALAGRIVTALRQIADEIESQSERLGRIDAVAGDGDHGRGMLKGVTAALAAAEEVAASGAGPETVLAAAGDAWAASAGGTSGALWGAALNAAGKRLPDAEAEYHPGHAVEAVWAAIDAMQSLGGAAPGDKTMLDAAFPFHEALDVAIKGGTPLREAWQGAALIANAAAEGTASMAPRVGRARPLAERSIGTPDAGAISFGIIAQRALSAWPVD